MRTILLTALAAAALSATVLAADNVPPEGFTALFNGKDFAAWQAKQGKPESEEEKAKWQEHWKVEAGIRPMLKREAAVAYCLSCLSTSANDSSKNMVLKRQSLSS